MSDQPSASEELQLLRSKAMLLLRRERELSVLSQERGRLEAWLASTHRLSHQLQDKHVERLLDDAVSALVDVLTFQVAAVYRYAPTRQQFALVSGKGHEQPVATLAVELSPNAYFRLHPSGLHSEEDARPELSTVADAVGLGRFFWMLIESPRGTFLLLAGFARSAENHGLMSAADLDHFELFGNHLGTLLNNSALIEALDQEKSELTELNTLLDHSLGRLKESQAELVESTRLLAEVSRRAGMADIATGVLHNVGNALNSVNVSTSLARERLQALAIERLGQVADIVLSEQISSGDSIAPKTQAKVANYLRELSLHWGKERSALLEELDRSRESIDHIKSIVTKQQAYAKAVGVTEPLDVRQLVDDAIGFVRAPLEQLGVTVERDYSDVPEVALDRHKVLQILVNLVSNAKHALADGTADSRRLTVRVYSVDPEKVAIDVKDNGVGVPTDHHDKIFRHGFTTKANGHGFGLHTSALAAREIGGSLSFASSGPGQGASFTLVLPVTEAAQGALEAHDAA